MIPIIHSLISNNGKYIKMPAWFDGQQGWGNLAIPSPYEEEVYAKYPISTKFVDGDRTFHYIQHGNALTRGRVCASWNAYSTPTSGDGTTRETATIAAAAVIDATTITCTDQGTITVANLFAGGYAMIYWEFLCLRIESSTIEDTSGQFTVTFDNPLPVAIASTSNVSLYRQKYADVRYLSSGAHMDFGSGVAVPPYTRTDAYYSWGQTWGPCGLAGTDNIGGSAGERALVADQGGALLWALADITTKSYQRIGYLLHTPALALVDKTNLVPSSMQCFSLNSKEVTWWMVKFGQT